MSALRVQILENNLRSLKAQRFELDQMIEFSQESLAKAYMEEDASLDYEAAIMMTGEIE